MPDVEVRAPPPLPKKQGLELHIQVECCLILLAVLGIDENGLDGIALTSLRLSWVVAVGDDEFILAILKPEWILITP